MDQSVDSALFFFPFFLVLNCTLNSLDFFVFGISLSLSLDFPLALSLRMSFLFYGSLSEGYIPALCRLMPTRTSKIIIIIQTLWRAILRILLHFLSTYQTCMKLTRKSTEFCQFFCRQNPPDPIWDNGCGHQPLAVGQADPYITGTAHLPWTYKWL